MKTIDKNIGVTLKFVASNSENVAINNIISVEIPHSILMKA